MSTIDRSSSYGHFSHLRQSEGSGVFSAAGLNAGYESVVELLEACSPKELKLRQRRLDRAIEELGLQFSATQSKGAAKAWRLDLFPLSLGAAAWQEISTGVVQRALAFNAYANDLHQSQDILQQRIIPHEIALGDPAFLRPLSGIAVPNGEYSQFGAFDLVNVGDSWQVVEHHMGTPFGLSHVLQNRRMLSQVFPEIYQRCDVAPVAGFSTYLLEMLRAQSSKLNPHVLLLTTGQAGQAYFEEAFIARHMGISIAQPRDLLVRESQVFLKTIRGLEPVDVIYRRVESSGLDPISVPGAGGWGVPGLINVWRRGNVSIVNAPGAGVADNRALLRYEDRIIPFYLKQKPILQSVPTYNLADSDQRAYVLGEADSFIIKPTQDHDILWRACGGRPSSHSGHAISRIAKQYPQYFVAQSIPQTGAIPRYRDGGFEAQNVCLRVYYILGKEPIVLPGGLVRHSSKIHQSSRLSVLTDGFKDVLVPDSVVEETQPRRAPAAVGERFSIGSRVAEALYWSGRYMERAENTARQFYTLECLRWDQMASSEQRTYWPLLQALAAATGQTKYAKRKTPPSDTLQLSRSLLVDPSEGASVRACLGFARNSLESVREIISPECREVLEEINLNFKGESKDRVTRARLRVLSERIVTEVARFNGTAERTMPHDDAWQFYRIGMFFERAMGAVLLLKVALPKIVQTYRDLDEENTDLTALLRLLGSLDAYRRTFRSRAYIDRVAQLILQSSNNPSSVSFCLHNLNYAIGTLSITGEQKTLGAELCAVAGQLINEIENLTLVRRGRSQMEQIETQQHVKTHLPFSPKQIASELEQFEASLKVLHHGIEDVFFSHQNALARNPTLFDLDG
jgi:uncharacterized circularly permuted ATP-grasp superfamily protein/uncharacterized alpha-E superfamily protein